MRSVDARPGVVICGLTRGGGNMGNQLHGKAGCDKWEREPGIDDDDWDPPGTPRIADYVPEPTPAPRACRQGRDGWWTEPARPRRPPAREPVALPIRVAARDPFGGMFNWQDD